MIHLIRNQPPAFRMIFMLEIWERFGFYSMQGILTLFLIRHFGYSDTEAYYCFGAFSALVYGLVAIGGFLGERVLGIKRTILAGLITLTIGYFALAITDRVHFFIALGCICVGNGLFKANPSNLLSKCYTKNDPRLHTGFTLYYMAINLGSTFSFFVGPILANKLGYGYAFGASSLGLFLGIVNYWYQRNLIKNIHTPVDDKKVSIWIWILVLFGIVSLTLISSFLLQHIILARNILELIIGIVVSIYLYYAYRESVNASKRMVIALILMIEAVVFFVLYQQMPTSLNLFAVHNVIPKIFSIPIDPQSFRCLNPIWIISLSPVLALFYNTLTQHEIKISIPYKFAAGMFCCGLSFSSLFFTRYMHDPNGMVSSYWLIISYCLQSIGELLVSALGVAMVAELVPNYMTGFVMGMWFLTSAIAGFVGASVASLTSIPTDIQPGIESLYIYSSAFGKIGCVIIGIACFMFLIANRLTHVINNTSET